MTNQPHREFIYRMAYQLGRHIIGYEVQKVLSLVDWMSLSDVSIGVIGYGEGGTDCAPERCGRYTNSGDGCQWIFPIATGGVAGTDLPECMGTAARIWRCRNRESHRTTYVDCWKQVVDLKSLDPHPFEMDAAVLHPDNSSPHQWILSRQSSVVHTTFISSSVVKMPCTSSLLRIGYRVLKRR